MTVRTIIAALLLGITLAVSGADTVTFNEKLSDKLVTYRDRELEETFTDVVRTVSGSVKAVATMPGLSRHPLREFSTWSLNLGGFSFTEDFSNADQLNDNKAVFIAYEYDDDDRPHEIGRLTLTRSGDTLTLVASSSQLEEGSFAAQAVAESSDESGPVTGSVSFEFSLDDFSISKTLYYTGKRTVTHRTIGGEFEGEEFSLYNIQISGEIDTGKPSVSITTPRRGFRTTNDTAVVRGRATDTYGLANLLVLVNDEPLDLEDYDEETGEWSAVAPLLPGINQIVAYGFDNSGNEAAAEVEVQRVVVSALRLTQTAGGVLTGVAPGQLLELGKKYKVTAKPDAQHLLHHWLVEDETRSGTTLEFVMETDLAIHAEFTTNKFLAARGTYQGLFQPVAPDAASDAPSINPTNCGHVTLTLTDKGRVTGKLLTGGAKISLNGSCDVDGRLYLTLQPKGLLATQLDVQFNLDDNVGDALGSVTTSEGTFSLFAIRPSDPGQASSTDGKRTFIIPGADADQAALLPAGDGAGSMTLKRGAIRLSGNLGDGTAISYAGNISHDGRFPLYVSLERGRKIVIGWIALASLSERPYADTVAWLKSPAPKDKLYPAGFQTVNGFFHAPYVPPARGDSGLGWTNGLVLIDGGNLSTTLTNRVQITGANAELLDGNPSRIAFKLKPATGLFTGSLIHPTTQKSMAVKGAWLQASETSPAQGGGWFLGTIESGYVEFFPMIQE